MKYLVFRLERRLGANKVAPKAGKNGYFRENCPQQRRHKADVK